MASGGYTPTPLCCRVQRQRVLNTLPGALADQRVACSMVSLALCTHLQVDVSSGFRVAPDMPIGGVSLWPCCGRMA